MKIYISGPMSGHDDLNFPAFNDAAALLRAEGHEVVNPAEINTDLNADWLECIIEDIKWVAACEAIYMLPGWEASKGAMIERLVAAKLGLKEARMEETNDELGT
jgi:hypothetical protein